MKKVITFKNKLKNHGFTLVELLVVMSIIGVLASLGVGSYMNAQLRGRDAQRKSDLKGVSHALEIYYSDHGSYPSASGTLIAGCPSTSNTPCNWGADSFTDGKTVYFKTVPIDPAINTFYVYRVVPSSNNQKYQLFGFLENTKDTEIIAGLTTNCRTGSVKCNFAVTSANTNPSE